MSKLNRVNFEFIRYANCWEDADLLTKALNPQAGKKVLSIGSAGDNSFSLLIKDPALVLAIDVSAVQIHLIELKKTAIANLSRMAYLNFTGFKNEVDKKNRWNTYKALRSQLPTSSKTYWNGQKKNIENGIIYGGKFENYFRIFSQKILPYIHNAETIKTLTGTKDKATQRSFYQNIWNNRRWNFLFKIFFSKRIMAWLGRDPIFLKQVDLSVGDFIFNKTENHLKSVHAQNNHILDFALEGKFENNLPHYVREENYKIIQANINKLVCQKGLIEDAFEKHGSFDYFNLSNIFEYLDHDHFLQLKKDILKGSNPNAKIAYWNLMVDRVLSENDSQLKKLKLPAEDLNADKGFFYKSFHLEKKVA